MMARDLMTSDVVTVPEDMTVPAVARVLSEARISAVPVTDQAHRLLGIVSELDLIRRLEADEARHAWFAALFPDERRLAERYTRTHGLRVGEVMTRQVATVAEDAPAAEIARLMEEKAIRSLPVVAKDGTLRGIVSRADLLRAVLAPQAATHPQVAIDQRIRRDIMEALHRQPWADVQHLSVEVQDGVALLLGHHRSPEARQAVRVLVEQVDGVQGVDDQTRPSPPVYLYG